MVIITNENVATSAGCVIGFSSCDFCLHLLVQRLQLHLDVGERLPQADPERRS